MDLWMWCIDELPPLCGFPLGRVAPDIPMSPKQFTRQQRLPCESGLISMVQRHLRRKPQQKAAAKSKAET